MTAAAEPIDRLVSSRSTSRALPCGSVLMVSFWNTPLPTCTLRVSPASTPETRRTTHFFWTYLNNWEDGDHNISRSLHQSLIEGFLEDKHLIEAQQVVIDSDASFELQAIASDAALSHFRMTFAKLVAQEQAEAATQQAAAPKVVKPHQVGMA